MNQPSFWWGSLRSTHPTGEKRVAGVAGQHAAGESPLAEPGPESAQGGGREAWIPCDMAYLNFDLAEQIGLDDYYWLADHFGFVLARSASSPSTTSRICHPMIATTPKSSGRPTKASRSTSSSTI